MLNPLYTISTTEAQNQPSRLLGKFFTSSRDPLSTAEKFLICKHLGVTFSAFEDGPLFEPTASGYSDATIGRPPDYTLIDGRKLWIYRPDEPLPEQS